VSEVSSINIKYTKKKKEKRSNTHNRRTKRKSKVIYRAISKIDSKMGKGLILAMD
jgi:hypothetical protein